VCLILINAAALAAQEIKALDDLSSAYYRHPVTDAHLAPWELRVLAVRLEGIGYGDGGRAIIGYYDLAREARAEIAKQRLSPKEKETWRARLLDLGLRVANTMIEMNNLVGAVNHLETLRVEAITVNQDDFLRGRLALLYLKIGNINAARKYVTCQSNSSPSTYSSVLEPLISMAEGNYAVAATKLESLKEAPGMLESLVTQNLAVCLLYAGRLNEARILLEELIADGQSFGTLLFNISTVFELCTDRSRNLKVALAEKLASRDGTETGWEKNNADFKL
jgi:tetratricopeptide (TPR) repeat protein